MAELSHLRAPGTSSSSLKSPSRQTLQPVLEQPSPQRRRDYFVSDDGDVVGARARPELLRKLPFQYRGDVFAQHGEYTDAGLYMSRLPASRKEKQPLSARVGPNYKLHPVKLAPVTPTKPASQQQSERENGPALLASTSKGIDASSGKASKTKSNRKRQYALAVEAMAANRSLHAALLSDNVVPSVMALSRSKDVATLAACVATLGHLSCEPEGRSVLLSHNALSLLAALALSSARTHEKLLLPNCVGTLANLTIEDGSESGFIKEKALDCLVKQRRTSALAERACTFAIFNLSCPQYAYPRVDDAVHALAEHGKDARDRETLSRAVYNLACTRMNHVKLVEPEAASMLRLLISCQQSEAARLNALAALWHLVESGACRRALVRNGDCVRVVVEQLPCLGQAASEEYVVCALATLICLTREASARELMGNAGALDALAALGTGVKRRPGVLLLIYRLIAVLLSAPDNIQAVNESVVQFLLEFQHERTGDDEACGGVSNAAATTAAEMSRYVLFALASILSWNESEDSKVMETSYSPGKHNAASSTRSVPLELDELLDEPQLLEQIYRHVAYAGFPVDSAQVRLQMVLLYNLSFRYPKADVARLAQERLSQVGASSKDRRILTLLGGSFFSLCLEYEVHHLLLAAAYAATDDKGGFLLQRLARDGDVEAQSMCFNSVCILFDGRSLTRDELLRLIDRIFPVVVEVCTRKGGPKRSDSEAAGADHSSSRAGLQSACAACLTRFASVAEYRLTMVERGLLDALAVLAGAEDDGTLRLCVHTYALLSQDRAVGTPLLRGGVIKALTLLAAAPEEAVRRACAVTLCNLSSEAAHVEDLVKLGALRALLVLSCVKSNDPETRRVCLKAVLNLLRVAKAAAMQRLCDDGLLWAFGVFTDAMEPRDYAILSDAFCVLALHSSARAGLVAKSSTVASLLQILRYNDVCYTTSVTVLKGLVNLLADSASAALLLKIGVLPHLVALIETEKEAEVSGIVAELLVLIFQNCSPDNDAAVVAYADSATMQAVTYLVRVAEQEELHRADAASSTAAVSCAQSCAVLLHLLSLNEFTRPALLTVHPPLGTALPALLLQAKGSTQTLLLRCLYNLTCDADLLTHIPMNVVIPALKVAFAVHQELSSSAVETDEPETAGLCAGILRNTSASDACHAVLSSEPATMLLCELFAVGGKLCRENVALATCNLFLGCVNSTVLLSRGVLPLVLSLCLPGSVCSSEAHAMCSAVLRKLAIAPGNSKMLLRGGAVGNLVLLMSADSSMFVKTNCVATFCLLAQKPRVPALLASQGVLASMLEFLEHLQQQQHRQDPRVESMCVDLLSTLAQFANASDPRERRLSSLLFRVIEKDDGATASAPPNATPASSESWQSDRSFLHREQGGTLPPTPILSVLVLPRRAAPVVPHAPRTISYPGYAVEVSLNASYIEMGTIEPKLPPVDTLDEVDAVAGRVEVLEFTPPPMFPKLRAPFTPLPLLLLTGPISSGATAGQIKSPTAAKAAKVVPSRIFKNSGHGNESH